MGQTNKSDNCLNCNTELAGVNFCPNCGQKNDASKLTLKHFFTETISNLFAFDGRFFSTLKNLFLRPGKVPKEYVSGKRTKYMNPVRIYFLSSVLLLGVIQIKHGAADMVDIQTTETAEVTVADSTTVPKGVAVEDIAVPVDVGFTQEEAPGFFQRLTLMGDFYLDNKTIPMKDALDSLGYEYTLTNRFMYKQGAKISEFDTDEFNKFLFSKMFWVLFLFLPILAILLKLLYIRRPFYYPEHLFFAFYNQSLFFILLSFAFLFNDTLEVLMLVLALLSFSVYLFVAMKRFFGQSTRKTLFKFVLLNLAIIPAFGLFFALSAIIALLFY